MPPFETWTLAAIALLALLAAGALAPLETLGWWAGWFGPSPEEAIDEESLPSESESSRKHFLVFLTGIHSVSGRTFARREKNLLFELRRCLPGVEIVELFPYSVTNRALTGQRFFAWFWRWALSMKLSRRALASIAGMVINGRNLWQVAVSTDRRYGPIYNHGSAEAVLGALTAAGYRVGSGAPVTLIGYSGGAQIAVGAAGHLKRMLDCPIRVVALGGVMSSDPGLGRIDRLYHLYGERDIVQRLSYLFFPGRWRILPYSVWNQARAQGRVQPLSLGPMDHTGAAGYLDSQASLPDGRTHLQVTVDAIVRIVREGSEAEGSS